MAKQVVQDVIPPERRSIRNVPIPAHRHSDDGHEAPAPKLASVQPVHRIPVHNHTEGEEEVFDSHMAAALPPRHDAARYAIWATAIVATLFLVFSIMLAFSRATVTVVPKSLAISVDAQLVADRSGAAESLPYETITVGKTSSAIVPAEGEQFISKKASGIIAIYNDFSNAPQRLIKNTRFETKDGLIFRIDGSVTIPGRSIKSGVAAPGIVEATVVADEAGEKYNLTSADFTIPGFKTDAARFKGFYAKTKTPTTEGFLGNKKMVNAEQEIKARTELNQKLYDALLKETAAVVPKGFVLFSSAFVLATTALPTLPAEGDGALIRQAATATAYIFAEKNIAAAIARTSMGDKYTNEPVRIPDVADLTFTVIRRPNDINPTLAFSVRGQSTLVWTFEPEELKKALVGQSRNDLSEVFVKFPAILPSSSAVIRPFFKRSFPADPADITIVEKLD